MPWIGLDPVTDLIAGAIGQKHVRDNHIGREAIEGRIDELSIGGQFNLEAFFDQDASTDTLGVRAVIGQKYSRNQFGFLGSVDSLVAAVPAVTAAAFVCVVALGCATGFGVFCFFCFFGSMIVPLAMIGALASALAGGVAT